MSEILTRYAKTVRLQAQNAEQSKPIRSALDEQVHKAVTNLTVHEPKLQVTRSVDESGNSRIQASANGFDIAVAMRSGQDSVFQGGQRRTFFSYTISAASNLQALDRAASASQSAGVLLRGGGGIGFAILFFWGIHLALSNWGIPMLSIPLAVVIAIVGAGAWIGERLGYFLGNRFEAQACARAERSGAMPQLEAMWADLEQQFNSLLKSHEIV